MMEVTENGVKFSVWDPTEVTQASTSHIELLEFPIDRGCTRLLVGGLGAVKSNNVSAYVGKPFISILKFYLFHISKENLENSSRFYDT